MADEEEQNVNPDEIITADNALARFANDPMVDPLDDSLSNEVLQEMVQVLKMRWSAPFTDEEPVAVQAARRFQLYDEQMSHTLLPSGANSLETSLYKIEFAVTRLQTQCERRGLSDSTLSHTNTIQDPGSDIFADILKIRECIVRMHRVLESDLLARKCCDPSWGSEIPTMRNIYGVSMIEIQKMNDIHSLVYFILKMLAHKGYRRYMEACYEEIISPPIPIQQPDGSIIEKRFATRSFRRVCDIEDFIRIHAPKETAFEMWKITLNGHNFSNAVKYLRECTDPEFAQLQPDRHWHSFKNGLQNTSTGNFYPFGHPTDSPPIDVCACNYHEIMFPWEEMSTQANWYQDIPTPAFHSIIEYQMSKENEDPAERDAVIQWIYILLGRFLFEVNEKDSWQVIPFFIGRAGTGKSKLLDSVKELFQEKDIALISNDTQKGFGLETVYDKFAWRCLEVKSDFALDQAQLQSMVTGEEVSIQRKNKPALNVVWKSPGMLAGNELANWSDNSGSISRRIIQIRFDRSVTAEMSDPFLATKIRAERPQLLHKLTSAYLDAVEQFGNKDIWGEYRDIEGNKKTVLPKYFHDLRERMRESTHAIVNFIRSSNEVVLDPKTFMPFEIFKKAANDQIEKNKLNKFMWKRDKYMSVLEDNKLSIRKLTSQLIAANGGTYEYAGKTQKESQEIIMGVNLLEYYRGN